MTLRLLSWLIFFTILPRVEATWQRGDQLKIGSQSYSVYKFTLSTELADKIKETKSQLGDTQVVSSANWDGFYAELELRETGLFLNSLSIDWHDGTSFTTKPIEVGSGGGIFCSWFSGELVELLLGEDGSILRRTYFTFRGGMLIGRREEKKPFWKKSL